MSISAIQPTAWVIANWKMHPVSPSAASELARSLQQNAHAIPDAMQVIVAPSFVHLAQVGQQLEGTPIGLAAQDICAHSPDMGAFTGDISAQMLADIGVAWVIIGHSERRQYAGENNAILAQKITHAQQAGLGVVLCVGETQAQFEAGQTQSVLAQQLAVLNDVQQAHQTATPARFLIAYEPVWAIGSGQVASPEQVSAIHGFIKATLAAYHQNLADTPILYGGSVKADNAAAFAQAQNVAGVLVGGASLDATSFYQIIQAFA